MENEKESDVRHLNSFLRGEISAVETYDQALEKLANELDLAAPLRTCRASHQSRVELLRTEVRRLGGKPAEGSGVWGGFAKLVEGGAKALGKGPAIAALEEGEDHGRDDYARDLDELSSATRSFVQTKLLPEQHRTHDAIAALKNTDKNRAW
jgi:uncharacterized protein (TIGR02284 family)